jgi:ribosomal protein S18 acetylase RimI-like enzyme
MEKAVTLKDGTKALVRSMRRDDLERSLAFFRGLPKEDRDYLRVDVTKQEVGEARIRAMETGKVRRLVAIFGDRIVADGALELSGMGWKEHVAEIRLIVAPDFQRRGMGALMASELYGLAAAERVEEIMVRMMRPQVAARGIFRKLGFREEAVLPDWVKDQAGRKQDLVLMRCNLEDLWREMEDYFADGDWERSR